MSAIESASLSIHRYAPAEVEALQRIIAECGEDMLRRYGLAHWVPAYPLEAMRRNALERFVYAVQAGKEVIGTFTLGTDGWKHDDKYWANPAHKPLYLTKLAIHPKAQGCGIGSWTVGKIEEIAREWKCEAIRFDAIAKHIKLVLFYQKLGYLERGRQVVTDALEREWEIVYLEKVLAGD
jgi:GNAT superfamily N-acetyltransferase